MAQIIVGPYKVTVEHSKDKVRIVTKVYKRNGPPDYGEELHLRTERPAADTTITAELLRYSEKMQDHVDAEALEAD